MSTSLSRPTENYTGVLLVAYRRLAERTSALDSNLHSGTDSEYPARGALLADRLPVARIVQAAQSLTNLRLRRRDSGTFIKWMAIKSADVSSEEWEDLTVGQVVRFCDQYFAVPGRGPHKWYDPLADAWYQDSTNGGWPIGTIWTQIDRANAKLRAAVFLQKLPSLGQGVLQVRTGSGSGYRQALEAIIEPSKRIPALELAVWRYRFGIPEGVADERSLVDAMVAELHMSEEERTTLLREELAS